jgi:hypothetical protein
MDCKETDRKGTQQAPYLGLLNVECSIYASAWDNEGRYRDPATGQPIERMTIHDFLMTNRYRPQVERLRQLIAEHGPEVKKTEAYEVIKKSLPTATLSGLFKKNWVYVEHRQRYQWVSRRADYLIHHTGFIVIDIDYGDNKQLSLDRIMRTLRHHRSIAFAMRSCSGMGIMALCLIAHPEKHKEHFFAIEREFATMGIKIDPACKDVSRLRFASYDSDYYLNEAAQPYTALIEQKNPRPAEPSSVQHQRKDYHSETANETEAKVRTLVEKIEARGIDITGDYAQWLHLGMSLHGMIDGLDYWERISRQWHGGGDGARDCAYKWKTFKSSEKDDKGIGYFFNVCRDYGITLR